MNPSLHYSLDEIHAKVLPVIESINRLQKDAFEKEVEVSFKNDLDLSSSILTETDLKSDQVFRSTLSEVFPEFGFVTEEADDDLEGREYFWVIDPIDGTANFASKMPIFGSSLALWGPNGPIYGIISFPVLGDMLFALKEKGAYRNDSRIKTRNDLSKQNFLYGRVGEMQHAIHDLEKLKHEMSFPFNFRCAIYHYALVAEGKFSGLIAMNFGSWDIAAGMLIAQEAGNTNVFLSPYPDPHDPSFRTYSHKVVTAKEETAKRLAKLLM